MTKDEQDDYVKKIKKEIPVPEINILGNDYNDEIKTFLLYLHHM